MGGSASVHAGMPPHWDQTRPPWTRHTTPPPPGGEPPSKQTPAYSQRAAGTHPTGMQSCYDLFLQGWGGGGHDHLGPPWIRYWYVDLSLKRVISLFQLYSLQTINMYVCRYLIIIKKRNLHQDIFDKSVISDKLNKITYILWTLRNLINNTFSGAIKLGPRRVQRSILK